MCGNLSILIILWTMIYHVELQQDNRIIIMITTDYWQSDYYDYYWLLAK